MKKNHENLPPEQTVKELANFAWCALVALRIAQEDGQALSPLSSHAFLMRWLSVAYKQKRFPRAIASDIEGLLILGRNKGLAARLFQRLEYLWTSCSGPVSAQTDLYRLTYAIEHLKSQGWSNAVVGDEEWETSGLAEEYRGTAALLVSTSALAHGFSKEGKLVASIDFWVSGDLSACLDVFNNYALPAITVQPDMISLQPLH